MFNKQLNKKKYYEIFNGTDKPLHNCLLARCATSLKPECEEENHHDKNEVHFILTYPLLDEKGVLQGIVRQHKNITEKKKPHKYTGTGELEKEYLEEFEKGRITIAVGTKGSSKNYTANSYLKYCLIYVL